MPIESAADLAAFFNPDEFGERITYNGAGGISAIWHRPAGTAGFGHGDVQLDKHLFEVSTAAPIAPARGDVIGVPGTGESFTVCDDPRKSDDGSIWLLSAA